MNLIPSPPAISNQVEMALLQLLYNTMLKGKDYFQLRNLGGHYTDTI